MRSVYIDNDLEEVLDHLRRAMKARGFSQVRIQRELGWKGSYISQLFNRTKALRVEQLLKILAVIGYRPLDFFREIYGESTVQVERADALELLHACFQRVADDLGEFLAADSAVADPETGSLHCIHLTVLRDYEVTVRAVDQETALEMVLEATRSIEPLNEQVVSKLFRSGEESVSGGFYIARDSTGQTCVVER